MHLILSPIGSAGDIHPMVGLALEAKRRGHRVTMVANGYFRDLIERVGLAFAEMGTREEFITSANHPDLWDPLRAFGHIYRHAVSPHIRRQYQLLTELGASGDAVGVVNVFGFGGLIAQEQGRLPVVSLHMQPAVIWSDVEPPLLPGAFGPRWFKKLMFRIGERFAIDKVVCPDVNRFRAELDLAPMRQTVRWWHSRGGVVCLFPEWFAPRQPDWPANLAQTNFPLWDERKSESLSADVEQFLSAGTPPIVFTPGSANMFGKEFFATSAEVCRRLGRRGMLLSRFAEHIPPSLPEGVAHFDYVPFDLLLPRAAAVVHHGGVGSTAQGLAAGIPQLIVHLAHDEADNAARIERLGVGAGLLPKQYRPERAAGILRELLESPRVATACRDAAARMSAGSGIPAAVDAIERFARA